MSVSVNMPNYCPFAISRKASVWQSCRDRARTPNGRALRSIHPDGEAACVCISVSCPEQTYVTRDYIVTHNTLSVAMEFASRLTGIPITREDGTQIPLRFRVPTKKNPSLIWVIGLNVDHIGQTLYHRLFSDGLGCNFRIIRDEKTSKWRAYNPNNDKARYSDSQLSPPLFGEHAIVQGSWHMESAAGNVFKAVRLLNGAVNLCAYPTTGDHPKQGDAVDGIWLDEDTANAAFLKEWQDRLISVRGWFLWSVWPKVANEALIKTLERAKKYEGHERPPIQVVQLVGSENSYSDKEGIAEGLARMDDDDDAAHRDRGDIEAFITGRRMYDFGAATHVLKPQAVPAPQHVAHIFQNLLHQNKKFPLSWTRYLVVDPSHTRTACLIGVVPPPEWEGMEIGNRLVIEEEIVVRKHTPAMFAEALRPYLEGVNFEAFIMDQQMGRQTTVGNDVTVFQAYENQFRTRGLMSRLTKYGFMRGCNDKALRRRTVRDLLEPTEGGWPKLMVNVRCGQTIREFYNYRKKEIKDNLGNMVPTDDAVNERVFDCMQALEYLSQYVAERFRDNTAYMEPEARRTGGSHAFHTAMGLIKKQEQETGGSYVHMGAGATA